MQAVLIAAGSIRLGINAIVALTLTPFISALAIISTMLRHLLAGIAEGAMELFRWIEIASGLDGLIHGQLSVRGRRGWILCRADRNCASPPLPQPLRQRVGLHQAPPDTCYA